MEDVPRPTVPGHAGRRLGRWRGAALAGFLALAGCSEPFGFIPGGALEGNEAVAPFDWSALADIDNVQLEFRPESPYSINIWAVGLGRDAYVATLEDGTRWTEYLRESPDVRVRVGPSIYELLAVRVLDAAERERVSAAFAAKYDIDQDDNWVATGQVFRLDRRDAESPLGG